MYAAEISALARHLFETHGAKSIAEAAQKAAAFEKAGDTAQSEDWQRIKAVLQEMQGPHQS